jgi:N-dimethylarginine dimethylaminohydrolase
MEGQIGQVDTARARRQGHSLFEDVAKFAAVEEIAAHAGSPDMCFTANAGLIESGRVLPARFRMPERSDEEAHFARWFESAALEIEAFPGNEPFEGEGDALFQPGEPLLWAGYGVRTSLESHVTLSTSFETEVVSLRLVDERFYHLDTCFAPLPEGRLLYYPAAFDARSQALIEERIPIDRRLVLTDRDAIDFACNVLRIDDRLYMNAASDELQRALANWGFEARIHPVDEFLKAGGGIKCLSLLLEQPEFQRGSNPYETPIRTARVQLVGHLLDDGLLRRALDLVTETCGSFRVEQLDLAERKDQKSRTTMRIVAPSQATLDDVVAGLRALGAELMDPD